MEIFDKNINRPGRIQAVFESRLGDLNGNKNFRNKSSRILREHDSILSVLGSIFVVERNKNFLRATPAVYRSIAGHY